MTSPDQTRALAEAIHELNAEQDRLFALIAALSNLLDRDVIVETVSMLLDVEPVDEGDCVVFADIAIRFGPDNRVRSMYRTIDESEPDARIDAKNSPRAGGV